MRMRKVPKDVFRMADELDSLPNEVLRAEYAEVYLEPIDFELHPYIKPENGYHIYGMMDGLVIFRVDGTMMIATPEMVNSG